ncbi:uncharacterized protein DUF4124 [Tahibacter aquaticus]|uniref:Uncharacterized protein DUF4124 n=1 Tax=Tahibacter aquaticus TaxID=520092 RepID=A0A4R6Z4P8_9GAMM|nr:DUF4124 domain-containing protein [Tahibacter aquaticus]TDR46519.1 uncharacterized protein DUF4124 [Tahibacter aquaticus]
MKATHVAFGLLAAVAATAGQSADKVYKWKDANGAIHFSDAPPPKGTEFNNVKIVNQSAAITSQPTPEAPPADAAADADPNKPAAAPQVAKDTSREARCKEAQQRVRLLEGAQAINIDRGDGKPTALQGEDRKVELDVARASATALCSDSNS